MSWTSKFREIIHLIHLRFEKKSIDEFLFIIVIAFIAVFIPDVRWEKAGFLKDKTALPNFI